MRIFKKSSTFVGKKLEKADKIIQNILEKADKNHVIERETDINYGAIYENVVAQELRAHGFDLYYFNSKKVGEVDFVVEYKGGVLPIEVKSGKDYRRHAALDHCLACADFHLDRAIVLCNGNVSKADGVLYAPIYMVMWLHHRPAQEAQVYKVDLSGLP